MKKYYMSSFDYLSFQDVRKCTFIKRMDFDTGNECVLVKLKPAVSGEPYGVAGDLEDFVLASRHEGEYLFPISSFPCFVHVLRPLGDDVVEKDVVSAGDFENVAWAELYRTYFGALFSALGWTWHLKRKKR